MTHSPKVEEGDIDIVVRRSPHPKCERCRRHDPDAQIHDYWPTYVICPRCAGVLLEIKWPPYILQSGELGSESADYYICKDEADWYRIKAGILKLPLEDPA